MMADAWDVQLDAANPAAAFSRHVLAIGGIHLSAWGIGCMCLAPSSAAPRTKKLAAFLNLIGHPGRRLLGLPPRSHRRAAVSARRRRRPRRPWSRRRRCGTCPWPSSRGSGCCSRTQARAWCVWMPRGRSCLTAPSTTRGAAPRITRVNSRADLVEYASPRVLDRHSGQYRKPTPGRPPSTRDW